MDSRLAKVCLYLNCFHTLSTSLLTNLASLAANPPKFHLHQIAACSVNSLLSSVRPRNRYSIPNQYLQSLLQQRGLHLEFFLDVLDLMMMYYWAHSIVWGLVSHFGADFVSELAGSTLLRLATLLASKMLHFMVGGPKRTCYLPLVQNLGRPCFNLLTLDFQR